MDHKALPRIDLSAPGFDAAAAALIAYSAVVHNPPRFTDKAPPLSSSGSGHSAAAREAQAAAPTFAPSLARR